MSDATAAFGKRPSGDFSAQPSGFPGEFGAQIPDFGGFQPPPSAPAFEQAPAAFNNNAPLPFAPAAPAFSAEPPAFSAPTLPAATQFDAVPPAELPTQFAAAGITPLAEAPLPTGYEPPRWNPAMFGAAQEPATTDTLLPDDSSASVAADAPAEATPEDLEAAFQEVPPELKEMLGIAPDTAYADLPPEIQAQFQPVTAEQLATEDPEQFAALQAAREAEALEAEKQLAIGSAIDALSHASIGNAEGGVRVQAVALRVLLEKAATGNPQDKQALFVQGFQLLTHVADGLGKTAGAHDALEQLISASAGLFSSEAITPVNVHHAVQAQALMGIAQAEGAQAQAVMQQHAAAAEQRTHVERLKTEGHGTGQYL